MARKPDNGKTPKAKVNTRIDPELKEWGIENGVNFSRMLEQKLREEKEKMISALASYHLPIELRDRTRYSVNVAIYFNATDRSLCDRIKVEDFSPKNPNICLRSSIQPVGDNFFLDAIWALDAESPDAAKKYVEANLEKSISIPRGLTLYGIEVEESVFDNGTKEWL